MPFIYHYDDQLYTLYLIFQIHVSSILGFFCFVFFIHIYRNVTGHRLLTEDNQQPVAGHEERC